MRVTIESCLETLARKPGAKVVVMVTFTKPKLNKRNRTTGEPCPYAAGVMRMAERYGMLGVSYENAVNNQRGREEQPTNEDDVVQYFQAKSLWNGLGEHIPGNPFLVRHNSTGKEYVTFMPRRNKENEVQNGAERWIDLATGLDLDPTSIEDYLPPAPKDSGRQETDAITFWKCIAIENVKQIRTNGEIYDIISPQMA